jgi:hypothetical protein
MIITERTDTEGKTAKDDDDNATTPHCAKCHATLTPLPKGQSYFVSPKDRTRGLLRTGSEPSWQCRGCGSISGDAEFVELNRQQRRGMEHRQKEQRRAQKAGK